MAAPIVYRWDDSGAPVARGERRSLCDVLYACLVTGYGSKAAAGWTREFVNATFDKAVFRNNPATGTGMYLRVDGAGSTYAYYSLLRAYEAMTDVDAGLYPFKASWTINEACGTSYQATTTARPWVLIADDRAFWFVCWTNATTTPTNSDTTTAIFFFGDLISRYAVDPYGCALGCYQAQSYSGPSWIYLSGPDSTAGYVLMPRASSGVATPIACNFVRGGGPSAMVYPGQQGVSYTAGGQILLTKPHVNEAATYTCRGWMPGLYYPCHVAPFDTLATVTSDGKSFLSIRNMYYGQSNTNILISLDDWRA